MKRQSLVVGLLAVSLSAGCTDRPSTQEPPANAPRLVLFIVLDQGRADYFERFAPYFSGGIRHLLETSVDFRTTFHDHSVTKTAPGHATLATGRHPAHHGVVGNSWYDRDLRKKVDAEEDDAYTPEIAPSRLLVTGIADWIKSTYPKSRTFSLSVKSRAAVMLGGKSADAAFWYDSETGRFTSSDYYPQAIPSWLESFHREPLPDRLFGTAWELLPETAAAIEPLGLEHVDRGIVRGRMPRPVGTTKSVPEEGYYHRFRSESPFADAYVGELAWALVEGEQLGQDVWPDFLGVSFSALDYIGHRYGPNSSEVLDTLLRLDRVLDLLFQRLDAAIGLEHVLISFSSDHGVAAIPEYSDGRRFWVEERGCVQRAEQALDARFGSARWLEADFVFDASVLADRGVARELASSWLAETLERCGGVERVWTAEELADERTRKDPEGRLFVNSYHPGRSEDLVLQAEPGAILGDNETNHGSPGEFDRRVPWFLKWSALTPRRIDGGFSTVDVAPTVAEASGVYPPSPLDGTSRLALAGHGDSPPSEVEEE